MKRRDPTPGMARTQIQPVATVELSEDGLGHRLTLACGHVIDEPLPGMGTRFRSCTWCPPTTANRWGR